MLIFEDSLSGRRDYGDVGTRRGVAQVWPRLRFSIDGPLAEEMRGSGPLGDGTIAVQESGSDEANT